VKNINDILLENKNKIIESARLSIFNVRDKDYKNEIKFEINRNLQARIKESAKDINSAYKLGLAQNKSNKLNNDNEECNKSIDLIGENQNNEKENQLTSFVELCCKNL